MSSLLWGFVGGLVGAAAVRVVIRAVVEIWKAARRRWRGESTTVVFVTMPTPTPSTGTAPPAKEWN